MGKPGWGHAQSLRSEHIGPVESTRGIETSQYPEEKKATAIPGVAASEMGSRPNRNSAKPGGVAVWVLWDRRDTAPEVSQSYKTAA